MTEEAVVTDSGFDIGSFSQTDEAKGEFLNLLNPSNGEPLIDSEGNDIGMYLLGKDSTKYRAAQRAVTNRRLNNKASSAITAERIEAEAIEVLSKCVVSWQGIVFNGEEMECNFPNARKLLTESQWVKEQVDDFVAERANFLGK